MEHERARSYFVFMMTMKLSAMLEPPLLLHAAAQHNSLVAREALRTCLQSNCHHPKVKALQQEPLLGDILELLEGTRQEELKYLLPFVAAFKFSWTAERKVEGEHASIHQATRKARSCTEAYDSLHRRLPEVKDFLRRKGALEEFCEELQKHRSPKRAAAALGMAAHPALQRFSRHGTLLSGRSSTGQTPQPFMAQSSTRVRKNKRW